MARVDTSNSIYNRIFYSIFLIGLLAFIISLIFGISIFGIVAGVSAVALLFLMLYYGIPKIDIKRQGYIFRYQRFLYKHYILIPFIVSQVIIAIVFYLIVQKVDMANGLIIKVIVPSLITCEVGVLIGLVLSKRLYGKRNCTKPNCKDHFPHPPR